MKVLTTPQVREADAYTIAHEPITSVDLMERAATRCYEKVSALYPAARSFSLFCGTGNNGGDGLVMARLWAADAAAPAVRVYVLALGKTPSDDFAVNMKRLEEGNAAAPRVRVHTITEENFDAAALLGEVEGSVVIDALLGSGATRPAAGLLAQVIAVINACHDASHAQPYLPDMAPNPAYLPRQGCPVVAVDYPSGLFDADNTADNRATAVRADHTVTFQVLKLAFLMPENEPHIGHWHVVDIGLHPTFLHEVPTPHHAVTASVAAGLLRERAAHSHKGTHGHALLCGGSRGKMGALVLAGGACLRGGCGLLTLSPPLCGEAAAQQQVPEALCEASPNKESGDTLGEPHKAWLGYQAVWIGPGMGVSAAAGGYLKKALGQLRLAEEDVPVVLDADALNLLAADEFAWGFLPAGTILTPHPKEFARLFGPQRSRGAAVATARAKAQEHRIVIVLKGHHTAVALPSGQVWFNTTGNSGMATGGSGDVLTGLLTSLLAQGYPPAQAAVLGVYLHGRAGELAAAARSEEALVASDITAALGAAFTGLRQAQREQQLARM